MELDQNMSNTGKNLRKFKVDENPRKSPDAKLDPRIQFSVGPDTKLDQRIQFSVGP